MKTWATFSVSLRTSCSIWKKLVGGLAKVPPFAASSSRDDFVERHVVGDALAQPVVVDERGLVGDLLRAVVDGADLQQLRPFHHPDLGELLAAEQLVHQRRRAFRVGVGEELLALLGCRQQADDIDEDAAQEGLVVAEPEGMMRSLWSFSWTSLSM